MADRTLEIRLSGALADLLAAVAAQKDQAVFTVAREALELGLRKMQAERCPPP